MGKSKDTSVVKIDSDLLKRVEDFILKEENKFKFVNKKQFIDLAVCEYLNDRKSKGGEKNEKN
jgi:hypothetical protein